MKSWTFTILGAKPAANRRKRLNEKILKENGIFHLILYDTSLIIKHLGEINAILPCPMSAICKDQKGVPSQTWELFAPYRHSQSPWQKWRNRTFLPPRCSHGAAQPGRGEEKAPCVCHEPERDRAVFPLGLAKDRLGLLCSETSLSWAAPYGFFCHSPLFIPSK